MDIMSISGYDVSCFEVKTNDGSLYRFSVIELEIEFALKKALDLGFESDDNVCQ